MNLNRFLDKCIDNGVTNLVTFEDYLNGSVTFNIAGGVTVIKKIKLKWFNDYSSTIEIKEYIPSKY